MPRKQTEKEARRSFADGSGGSNAERAVEGVPVHEDRRVETPSSKPADPLAAGEKPDQLAGKERRAEDRQEALIDEALEETFPSSDPISPKHIT